MHVAQRSERFLDTSRRPDGSRWSGQAIDEATDGIVTRSYITNLRKGRIENPGYEKMRVIAKAMGVAFGEGEIVEGEPLVPTLHQFSQFIEGFVESFVALFSQEPPPDVPPSRDENTL